MRESFEEFIRPRSMKERLAENKEKTEAEKRKKKTSEIGTKRKHDIAI